MGSEIGSIIEGSLQRFLAYVLESGWCGRENEAVSLYAFGFLQRERSSGGGRLAPTMII